jgi:multiple sugar transport system substrate-binding protein
MIHLTGITWDHSRGYDPMVATAQAYSDAHPGVTIEWRKRSLKEFGDYPIEKLAQTFDLLVIDHPFVGFAVADGCLLALDEYVDASFLADQAANSVGKSHESYLYGGHQWALAIDAAAQISSYRGDLLASADVPRTWEGVLSLARELKASRHGWVGIPLCPIDALMSLFSIVSALGEDPCATPDVFVSREIGRRALDLVVELAAVCHPESLKWNPIKLYDAMSSGDDVVYCPLAFGYSNYGRPGYARHLISFANVPAQGRTLKGGILGGTGYAISSQCQHVDEAIRYGMFVASADVQSGPYFDSGGQPGHRRAWLSDRVNAASNEFFRSTLLSLDHAYLRPRYNGYLKFQEDSWYALHAFLETGGAADQLLDRLDEMYRHSLQSEQA